MNDHSPDSLPEEESPPAKGWFTKRIPRRFTLKTLLLTIGAMGVPLAGYKYWADYTTEQQTATLTSDDDKIYKLRLQQPSGKLRAKHIYVVNDGIAVNTMNNTWVKYDLPPGTIPPDGKLRIDCFTDKDPISKADGVEITLRDCAIPHIELTDWQFMGPNAGKTVINIEGDVKTALNVQIKGAEIRGVSENFIERAKAHLSIAALDRIISVIEQYQAVDKLLGERKEEKKQAANQQDPVINENKTLAQELIETVLVQQEYEKLMREREMLFQMMGAPSKREIPFQMDGISMDLGEASEKDITLISKDKKESLHLKPLFEEKMREYETESYKKSLEKLRELRDRNQTLLKLIGSSNRREGKFR